MPSESVAGFLDHAQASRVLFPEQIDRGLGKGMKAAKAAGKTGHVVYSE